MKLIGVIVFCVLIVECSVVDSADVKRRVLLLSFDGFRWDYVGKFSTPNLDEFAREGVHAPLGITTAFVTKTFPDHYTIATGLYVESHGITNNKMYDPVFNDTFRMGNVETRWWDGGQPIWTTVTLQGLKAGVFYWPGSEVLLEGVRPHHWKWYNKSVPFEERVDTVVNWMAEDDIDFAASYYYEPDGTGHKFGAMSVNVGEAVQKVDTFLGYFTDQLKKRNLYDTTNIIIVSDHGMANITADDDHVIYLSDFVDVKADIELIPDEGTLVNIRPRLGRLEHVYHNLRRIHPNVTVYKKDDIPYRFHYRNHRRIQPIVAFADEGYYIVQNRPKKGGKGRQIGPGEHGYDNSLSSMRPIFFARGPNFKKGHKVTTSYETVNIYPLICHLLNVEPTPNNGSLKSSLDMLTNHGTNCISSVPCVLCLLFALTICKRDV